MRTPGIEKLSIDFESPAAPAPSLDSSIQQLIKQKGALRRITEQSLVAELDHHRLSKDAIAEDEDEVDSRSDHETPQARQEMVWKAREDMLQRLAYAQNEILSALDFVSLLLSGTSTAAQVSMSPALKQLVPTGTIEGHLVEDFEVPVATKQKLTHVSEGWKSKSFKSAFDKFNEAADRLENEAQRQTRYWDQIAALKAKGWSISRLPSDKRAIGVHYGFSESAPQFRNRSFALLRQDDHGNLQLDPRSIPRKYVATQVIIIRNGNSTGRSRLHRTVQHLKSEDNGIVINEQIKKARDTVFEEELFYEVNREARIIANQGVHTRPKAVEAIIDKHTGFQILEVDVEDMPTELPKGADDELADAIAVTLHLSLSLEHRNSRLIRNRPPGPMSMMPPKLREYALLRPVVAHLRHQASLSAAQRICTAFSQTFLTAGISFTFQLRDTKASEERGDIEDLRQPVQSELVLQINSGRSIGLQIETYLSAPLYGTNFRSRDMDFGFVQLRAVTFTTADEAKDYLARTLALELISQTSQFEVIRPHSGEVSLRARPKIVLAVSIRPECLSLVVNSTNKGAYHWRPQGFQEVPKGNTGGSKSFQEIVVQLGD